MMLQLGLVRLYLEAGRDGAAYRIACIGYVG